jgi:hypothetical protein
VAAALAISLTLLESSFNRILTYRIDLHQVRAAVKKGRQITSG